MRSKKAVSDIGPAVESRLKTAHSTRSASGVAAPARSSGSTSHQRPGSISARRRWVGRPSSSRISSRRRSTGSPVASRPAAVRRGRPPCAGGRGTAASASVADSGAIAEDVLVGRQRVIFGRHIGLDDGIRGEWIDGAGCSIRADAKRGGCEAAQLSSPIEPDQDLAEQPFEAGRLAPGAQRLDGRLGHRPRGLNRRERTIVEPLGRREEAARGDDVRIARAPRDWVETDIRSGARPGRQESAGREELDQGLGAVVRIGEAGTEQAITGGRAG